MSLQVNLSSRELLTAYQNVVNANGIDWALFTYDKGTNDLKVQSTGDGGLEELEEEFSDGRHVHNTGLSAIRCLNLTTQDSVRVCACNRANGTYRRLSSLRFHPC